MTNDGVEGKARTRNTDDDRVGSTKSECVRCGAFHKKQISKTQKREKSGAGGRSPEGPGPRNADPLETAISAPAPGAAEPLETRKIQQCFLSSLEAGREEKRGGNHWLVVEAVRPILR